MKNKLSGIRLSLWSLVILTLSLTYVSCSDEEEMAAPVLRILSENQVVPQAGGEAVINFQIENPVDGAVAEAESEAAWVRSAKTEIQGKEGKILLQLEANEQEEAREARMTLSYPNAAEVSFTLTQPGKKQTVLVLEQTSLEVPAEGGACSVALQIVNPQEGAELTAQSEAAWLADFQYDAASGKFQFVATQNESSEKREAQLVLSYPSADEVTLNVVQLAGEEKLETLVFHTSAVSVFQTLENKLTNYYLVLTTCPYSVDNQSQIVLKEPGYLVAIDLYALAQEKGVIPAGAYKATSGSNLADMTFDADYTSVIYQDGTGMGKQVTHAVTSDLVVEFTGGEYYIHSTFKKKGENVPFEYRGSLQLQDVSQSQGGQLPLIGHDVQVEGFKAVGTYFGNMLMSDTGMMSINIMDKTYTEEETKGQGGYAVSLTVFTQLFPQSNQIRLIPGTYPVNTEFKKGTWLPGLEINAMGSVIPFGTYAHCDDGSNMGRFMYANDGSITIESIESGYRIVYDLTSQDGHKITGSYEGFVEVIDQSNDENKDDGTSTLTDDHNMDLSAIQTARLFQLGDIESTDGVQYTHNRIDIGSRGGWDKDDVLKKGDTFTMDLVMQRDAAGKIVPGTYKVSTDHFPASIVPGAAIRGYIWSGEYMGTGWLGFDTSKTQDLYMNGHAAAYGGEIVVEKSDLGENYYTFTIDMVCVRKMHVRGTWTGPVIHANDGTPVLPSVSVPAAAPTIKTIVPAEAMRAAASNVREEAGISFCPVLKQHF